jgi:hypothetical protein
MSRRKIGFHLSGLAILLVSHQTVARGDTTPVQTVMTGMVQTNWIPGTTGVTTPTFTQFDPSLGTLTAINLTLTTNVDNTYSFDFVNKSTITVTNAISGSSLIGPTISIFGPGATVVAGSPGTVSGNAIFTAVQPVDMNEILTESSGTYTQTTNYTNFYSTVLTDTAGFIGTGSVVLDAEAFAYSTFHSDNGNGGGYVLTDAGATVSLYYTYTAAVPEPSSSVLLALGIGSTLIAGRKFRNRAA